MKNHLNRIVFPFIKHKLLPNYSLLGHCNHYSHCVIKKSDVLPSLVGPLNLFYIKARKHSDTKFNRGRDSKATTEEDDEDISKVIFKI